MPARDPCHTRIPCPARDPCLRAICAGSVPCCAHVPCPARDPCLRAICAGYVPCCACVPCWERPVLCARSMPGARSVPCARSVPYAYSMPGAPDFVGANGARAAAPHTGQYLNGFDYESRIQKINGRCSSGQSTGMVALETFIHNAVLD